MVTTNTAVQQKAADLDQKLRAEDGIAQAVRFIENQIQGHKTPSLAWVTR